MGTKKDAITHLLNQHRYMTVSQVAENLSISHALVYQYLHDFKRQGKLFDAGHGVYSSIDTVFSMPKHSRVDTLVKTLNREFPNIKYTIWNTQQLQPLYLHSQQYHHTFIDVEKIGLNPVYELVKEDYRSTYFSDDNFEVDDNPVVIRKLVTRAPTDSEQKLLAKILVDMYFDLDDYTYIGRSEYWEVWRGLLSEYRVPFGWIIGYSKRRNRFKEIFQGLLEHIGTDETFLMHIIDEER